MEQAGLPVTLGEHEYHLLPQRHAKILRRLLGKNGVFSSMDDFQAMSEDKAGLDQLFHAAGGKLYEVVHIFIPDLMPRWEFEGFGSESAMAADTYDESGDRSPTFQQLEEGFRVVVQVNGLRWVRRLADFFNQEMLRAEANAWLARILSEARTAMIESGTTSPSSPPQNGESALTSSGTSEITPPPSSLPEAGEPPITVSPTPGSTPSSTPTSAGEKPTTTESPTS